MPHSGHPGSRRVTQEGPGTVTPRFLSFPVLPVSQRRRVAYAAHKALSPVRFPPTVALTPVVAGWMGKDVKPEDEDGDGVTDGEAE